ncbi:MAG: hypothetical protein EAZ55_01905 [Cytophagales bacterium]|nr:MAG: hypothetical protein EAZ55_01905 [Cytophagales bacterium]
MKRLRKNVVTLLEVALDLANLLCLLMELGASTQATLTCLSLAIKWLNKSNQHIENKYSQNGNQTR